MTIINDPRTQQGQAVDSLGRSCTFSVTETHEAAAVVAGKAWNVNGGDITLTGTDSSVLSYFKNNGSYDIHIPLYVFITQPSTGGDSTDNILCEIISNPDSVSFSTSLVPVNRKFGVSALPLGGDYLSYKGSYGATATGGTVAIQSRVGAGGRLALPVYTVLPPGNSVALRVTPPSGNTSMKVQVATVVFEGTVQ